MKIESKRIILRNWDERHVEGEYAGTQHDTRHFDIAIDLANYL